MKFKFIKLTNIKTESGILVNVNDITFVTDEIDYREVHIKLHDRMFTVSVEEPLDAIYGFIEANKAYQPIFD